MGILKTFWKNGFGAQQEPIVETRNNSFVQTLGGDNPQRAVIAPPRGILEGIDVSEALSIASVYRAVTILSNTVAQLPFQAYRGKDKIDFTSANSNLWVRQPDPSITKSAFLQRTVFSMATRGNAYWRLIGVNAPGDVPVGLEVLNPAAMNIIYDIENGYQQYQYAGYMQPKVFETWQIKHIKLTELFGSPLGIGPIQACNTELKAILDLRNYASNIFTSTFPLGTISVPDIIDPDLAAEYQAAFLRMTADGKPAVFGNGGKYDPNMIDPAKAQMLQNQNFAISQVARMFGIPVTKLHAAVEGRSMTYTNTEMMNIEYLQDTLMGYILPIEESLSDLIPRGQTVKLDVTALLRADTGARYTALATATWLTPNEKREMDNLQPLPGGDVLAPATPKPAQAAMPMANPDTQGATA